MTSNQIDLPESSRHCARYFVEVCWPGTLSNPMSKPENTRTSLLSRLTATRKKLYQSSLGRNWIAVLVLVPGTSQYPDLDDGPITLTLNWRTPNLRPLSLAISFLPFHVALPELELGHEHTIHSFSNARISAQCIVQTA